MRPSNWSLFAKAAPWNFVFALILLPGAMASILSAQTLTTLAVFNGTNGESPQSPLVQGTDGNLYGTTAGGGTVNQGTFFKITRRAAH